MRLHAFRSFVLFALLVPGFHAAYATCGGGGGGGTGGMMPAGASFEPQAYVVPWKILDPSTAPSEPLVLYWFPAGQQDFESSPLKASRVLTIASSQCVAMEVVQPTDTATATKFEVSGVPAAILVGDGQVVARGEVKGGRLALPSVEKMVKSALGDREKALSTQLDAAKKIAAGGEKDAAIAAYRQVWDARCLAPKQGRAARKALEKLGVTVEDARLRETDPDLTPAMNARLTKLMDDGLAAEIAEDYARAGTRYRTAAALDLADPVPARFLGELYRHHTGEWALARKVFEHLLTMQPDPLSEAVALHGLGKMTIHMGNSANGLALFEQSIAVFPLALTYRNLAVYWNSELERAKADGYMKQALALDPKDPFNLIFAATYLADSDRKEEALRIARENEGLLAASYNLAAIHALLGNKQKAMELLHRHFYRYERYDDVRAMEMWEARVDYVFTSIKDDPDFIELTAMAR